MPRLLVFLFGIICLVPLLAPAVFAQDTLTFRIDSYIIISPISGLTE